MAAITQDGWDGKEAALREEQLTTAHCQEVLREPLVSELPLLEKQWH